jgi:tetratricopeptide (TPR) repeat protein
MLGRVLGNRAVLFTLLAGAIVASSLAPRVAHAQQQSDCDKYFDAENWKLAAKYCDAEINSPGAAAAPATYQKRAFVFYRLKQVKDGIHWIETVAEKKYPGDPYVLEAKAVLLRVAGQADDAVKAAEGAVAKDPKRFLAQKIIGDYYTQPKFRGTKARETIAAYEAFLKLRPEDQSKGDGIILVSLGFAYMKLGVTEHNAEYHKKAEAAFDKALKINGNDSTVGPNAQKGKCAVLVARAQMEGNNRLYDQAITVCEAVVKNRKGMRGDASPFYNVGTAYLERNQLDKAMAAANSYIQQNQNDFRGYLLRGRIYFRQDKYNEAEGQFSMANEKSPNNPDVGIARAKNYRKQKQPKKAIELLEKVASARPNDPDVVSELAFSYLENNQPTQAATSADRALKIAGQEKSVPLLALAGDAYYDAGDLPNARDRYTKAHDLNKTDARAKTGLVDTIVRQAYAKFDKNDIAGAEKILMEAYAVDPESQIVNFNLGVIAVDQGDWQNAVKFLQVRLAKTPNDLPSNRLIAKAYLNLGDAGKAGDFYGKAEALAKDPATRNNLVLSEVYTEWAPLLLAAGKTDDVVDKLELAEQYAANQPWQKATQHNLQIAYFRRGYERWRARKYSDAVSDLEGATRYPANLSKAEEDAFGFALGLAYLANGDGGKALPIFQKYSKLGVLPFLKPPWDKVGAEFFMAYTLYREGTPKGRQNAAVAFAALLPKTSGAIAVKTKQFLRSSYEYIAFDSFNNGDVKGAQAALKKADGYAGPTEKKVIDHNNAVIAMIAAKGAGAEGTFARLGDDPPEALLNLGIIKDQNGDAKKAFDLWVAAKAKGVRSAKLDDWIDAKKRIFNFQ